MLCTLNLCLIQHVVIGQHDKTHLDALLGKAYFLTNIKKDHSDALGLLNHAVALFPSFLPGLLTKSWVHMALGDWDGCKEIALRCLELDSECIPALHIQSVVLLVRSGKCEDVCKQNFRYFSWSDKT